MKKLFLLLTLIILHGGNTMAFTLTTTAFNDNQPIPVEYTCQGQDKVPVLNWTDPPKDTKSFVLIMDDPDAPMGLWIHWTVFNIPANIRQWPTEGTDAVEGNNTWNKTGYGGPCPPAGDAHHYIFTLYAIDTLLDLPTGSTAAQVREAIKGHVLEQTKFTGLYKRA